jgi:ABC-type branched-subunit amino acid transport system ATPase component
MIEIDNLTVQFGGVRPIEALGVRLDQPIVGLIGPNGAGKTTLLNVLSGFVTPTNGTVRVNGQDVTHVPPHQRAAMGLRRTFQTDQIADDLTLWENVMAIADHAGIGSSRERDAEVARAIDYVGLTRRIHRRGNALSTEERHLAEVAKALIGKPQLVMLDEPGAGMSAAESSHLEAVLKGIPEFCGAQLFLIDHDVELIAACCSQTMVLDFGKLLAVGPTAAVLEQPEVRRAYLGNYEVQRAAE